MSRTFETTAPGKVKLVLTEDEDGTLRTKRRAVLAYYAPAAGGWRAVPTNWAWWHETPDLYLIPAERLGTNNRRARTPVLGLVETTRYGNPGPLRHCIRLFVRETCEGGITDGEAYDRAVIMPAGMAGHEVSWPEFVEAMAAEGWQYRSPYWWRSYDRSPHPDW